MLSKRKINVNARIVLVGASTSGISFLETLLTKFPRCSFSRLTVLSPGGLVGKKENILCSYGDVQTSDGSYSDYCLSQLVFEAKARILDGQLLNINRKNKSIRANIKTINGDENTIIPFDFLVLAPELEQRPPCDTTLNDVFNPEGWTSLPMSDKKIKTNSLCILFGSSLSIFACVNELLKSDVDGQNVVLILGCSKSAMEKDIFGGNSDAASHILKNLESSGISILWEFSIEKFEIDETGHDHRCIFGTYPSNLSINSAVELGHFIDELPTPNDRISESPSKYDDSHPHFVSLKFSTFIHDSPKHVNIDIQKAVTNAGLVYDGRIVIDTHFRTNDSNILALGYSTKFSKKYCKTVSMESLNAREIGSHAGRAFMTLFRSRGGSLFHISTASATNQFVRPKLHACNIKMPGNVYFTVISIPGFTQSRISRIISSAWETETVAPIQARFCKIYLNKYDYIVSVQCLTRNKVDIGILCEHVGIHSSYLGDIDQLECNGGDLLKCFHEVTVAALFHEGPSLSKINFPDRYQTMKEPFLALRALYAREDRNNKDISSSKRSILGPRGSNLPLSYIKSVENHILSYLKKKGE